MVPTMLRIIAKRRRRRPFPRGPSGWSLLTPPWLPVLRTLMRRGSG